MIEDLEKMADLSIPKDLSSDEANKYLVDACLKFDIKCPPPQTTARLLDKVNPLFIFDPFLSISIFINGIWEYDKVCGLMLYYCFLAGEVPKHDPSWFSSPYGFSKWLISTLGRWLMAALPTNHISSTSTSFTRLAMCCYTLKSLPAPLNTTDTDTTTVVSATVVFTITYNFGTMPALLPLSTPPC